MAKPAPDPVRIHQLTEEVRRLKAEEDKETLAATKEKENAKASKEAPLNSSVSKPTEKEDIFTKLFRVPSPFSKEWVNQTPKITALQDEKDDFFKLSPVSESSDQGSSFMVFRNNDWEGPFNLSQLRSMGPLNPTTWVCRVGSQLVTQAYETPDLHPLIQ